jgi:hypothetical protein
MCLSLQQHTIILFRLIILLLLAVAVAVVAVNTRHTELVVAVVLAVCVQLSRQQVGQGHLKQH